MFVNGRLQLFGPSRSSTLGLFAFALHEWRSNSFQTLSLPGTQNASLLALNGIHNAAQVVNSMSWFQPTEVPRLEKERKTSSGRARLRRRQDSLHMPDTICFFFEFIWHPTALVLMSKSTKSVSSLKNLTTKGFIRMTYWDFNHSNRSVCSTSGALV